MNNFENELRSLINKYSLENDLNTPDFILAAFMKNCLDEIFCAQKHSILSGKMRLFIVK